MSEINCEGSCLLIFYNHTSITYSVFSPFRFFAIICQKLTLKYKKWRRKGVLIVKTLKQQVIGQGRRNTEINNPEEHSQGPIRNSKIPSYDSMLAVVVVTFAAIYVATDKSVIQMLLGELKCSHRSILKPGEFHGGMR